MGRRNAPLFFSSISLHSHSFNSPFSFPFFPPLPSTFLRLPFTALSLSFIIIINSEVRYLFWLFRQKPLKIAILLVIHYRTYNFVIQFLFRLPRFPKLGLYLKTEEIDSVKGLIIFIWKTFAEANLPKMLIKFFFLPPPPPLEVY